MKIEIAEFRRDCRAFDVLTAAPAFAAKKVLLKVPIWFGAHLVGPDSTPAWLAENVNEASGGGVKMKIHEPGKLIPPKETLKSVSRGQVNTGWNTPGGSDFTIAYIPVHDAPLIRNGNVLHGCMEV